MLWSWGLGVGGSELRVSASRNCRNKSPKNRRGGRVQQQKIVSQGRMLGTARHCTDMRE